MLLISKLTQEKGIDLYEIDRIYSKFQEEKLSRSQRLLLKLIEKFYPQMKITKDMSAKEKYERFEKKYAIQFSDVYNDCLLKTNERNNQKIVSQSIDKENLNIEEKIERFETKNDIHFPKIYKTFLLKYNGGDTPKTSFKINKVHSDVRAFYGFYSESQYYDIDKIYEFNLEEFLDDEMFPIAENVFGDYIMINLSKEKNGEICFYYHDRKKKYIHLTDDLIEFVEKCKSEKIGYVKTIDERIASCKAKNIEISVFFLIDWQRAINKYGDMYQEEVILP